MRDLTVLYDADCPLCSRVRDWLEEQPQLVPLRFLAAGSEEARRRFPGLNEESILAEVTVVGSGGEVWRGAKAWLMCLWALRRYRLLAVSWSAPDRLPWARRLVAWVSRHRYWLGDLVGRTD